MLRLWQMGRSNREIERLLGVNRKTVRRYVEVAVKAGLTRGLGGISVRISRNPAGQFAESGHPPSEVA